MITRFLVATILSATWLISAPASACRVNLSPEQRLQRGQFDTIAVACISRAGYTGESRQDWRPWRAVATIEYFLDGRTREKVFEIGRTGSSAACDDGIAPPDTNDVWILYIQHVKGKAEIRHSYPAGVALKADPKLRIVRRRK